MKIDVHDPVGAVVISIEDARYDYMRKRCKHVHVTVDSALATLRCDDCREALNPIEWIVELRNKWANVQRMTADYNAIVQAYNAKKRCRCEHCKRITHVTPPTNAEIVKFKK